MQKREVLHCRRRGKWCLLAYLAVFILLISPSLAWAVQISPVWVRGRGGAAYPSENLGFIYGLRNRSFFGVVSTFSNPYSLDDLVTSGIRIGCHSPRRSFWLNWFHVHHMLYREDRLSLTYGQPVLFDHLLVETEPSLERRSVRGLCSESTGSLRIAAAYDGFVSFGLEGYLLGRGCAGTFPITVKFSYRIDSVAIVLNRVVHGEAEKDLRIGVEVKLCEGFSVLSGYRQRTDELFAGVLFRSRNLVFGFSFCHHPSLGRTLSLGIGRLWWR